MGEDKDGIAKNLEVYQEEVKEFLRDELFNIKRLRYVTLPGMKSRVPGDKIAEGHPDNNGIFHLYVALFTTFTGMRRVLGTLLAIWFAVNYIALPLWTMLS